MPVLDALRGVFAGHTATGGGALLEADCGVGKTFMGIAAAAAHGRKTAVVVNKGDLQDQWRERFSTFAPTAKVGVVRSDTIEVDGFDVVIFMAQSVCSGRYDADKARVFGGFGLLIVDECHHWAAPTSSNVSLSREMHSGALSNTRQARRAWVRASLLFWTDVGTRETQQHGQVARQAQR